MGAGLVDALDGLTVRQAKAIEVYAENGGNGTQAYLAAYPNASPASATVGFSRLLSKDNVQVAIRAACERLNLTPDTHLAKLAELRDAAQSDKQYAAAIKGEELRGRVAGFYVEKTEHASDFRHEVVFRVETRKTTAG